MGQLLRFLFNSRITLTDDCVWRECAVKEDLGAGEEGVIANLHKLIAYLYRGKLKATEEGIRANLFYV